MKLSIRLKLLIGFALLLIIASIIQGFVYIVTKNYVQEQIDNTHIAEANRGATAIKNFFSELTTESQGLAQHSQKNKQDIQSSASYLIKTNDYIKKITLLSTYGRELEKYDIFGPVSSDKLTYEVSSEPFEKALGGSAAISKVYYLEEGLAPHLDLFTPVYGAKASVSGVIKMRVNLHQVKEELSDIRLGKNGFIYVVDNEGRLIAHESNDYVLERPNLSSRPLIANALINKPSTMNEEQYINKEKVRVVSKAVVIPGLDWIAVFEQPMDEAYSFLTTLRNLFVITIVGSIILLLIIAMFLSENLTRPIRKLEQSAQRIESGRSKQTEVITTGDEIESLSKSFASMTNLLMQRDQWLEKITLKLNDTNEKLKEMDKLKDDFVSLASHELRTPMTAIKSYLSMALDGMGGQLTEKQRFYIDRAYVSTDRLIDLVNDMLNISRIESGRLTLNISKVFLDKLIQEVVDDVNPRSQELGVQVILDSSSPPPPIIGDYDKLKEVLFNLLGNSLKFTPKGGKITVSFKNDETFVIVKIVDTGSGIEADDLPKLFQKFSLLAGSYKNGIAGTGLGLYICKSIIELHEGTITAASAGRDKGSEFVFTLKIFNNPDLQRLTAKFAHDSESTVELVHNQI